MSSIWITLDREGFHRWPDAPAPWLHLRHEHRHLFKLTVETPVNGSREVAFEELRRLTEHAWPGPSLRDLSCEQIAARIAQYVADELGRPATVSCSEDGEAGARVTVDPD